MSSHGKVPWSTGLCDCNEDTGNCFLTCFCPCISFGRIAEIADEGSFSCGACCALYVLVHLLTSRLGAVLLSCVYRRKLKKQYNLEGNDCTDFCLHLWCSPCATCQEYRELQHQGFDLTKGWDGNVGKRRAGVEMAPGVQKGMNR
ncbi:hypothetical protein Scep_022783 [Stephania cephalantha]|uniref:Uncharacterized protein n=1 Tax=Stephania cephalantha TaxID=152367 RepID=A0AAP0FIX7_9MAGN